MQNDIVKMCLTFNSHFFDIYLTFWGIYLTFLSFPTFCIDIYFTFIWHFLALLECIDLPPEYKPNPCARRWFLLDVLVVGVDWIEARPPGSGGEKTHEHSGNSHMGILRLTVFC